MSHFFFWLCHYLTLRKKRNLNFSCYITHHAFIYHTLCCCSSKTATTPGSRVSLGTLRPLINFTAGGKALGWEIPFPWHTRCCDLVGEARGFSWRSRENWSKVRGHRQAEQLRELPVPCLLPWFTHRAREQGDSTLQEPLGAEMPGSTSLSLA